MMNEDPAPTTEPGPPSFRHLPPPRFSTRLIEAALFVVGLLALGAFGVVQVEAIIYQAVQGWRLERASRADPTPAALTKPEPGGVIGRMEIPRLGLSTVIREGIDTRTLLLAAGHVPGTALPGHPGNVVVGGHRDSFFRDLRRIQVKDTVRVVTPHGSFVYQVESTRVITPDRTEVLGATADPTLTLITCFPFGFIGPAPKRFVVRARQLVDVSTFRAQPVARDGQVPRGTRVFMVAPALLSTP